MNTSGQLNAVAPVQKITWLLKREFWENKGGFFWAPVWAGGISLVLTIMAMTMGQLAIKRSDNVMINGLDFNQFRQDLNPEQAQHLADAVSISIASAAFWPLLVLGFVVFFYCLASLYDERKDRSVLFWKSLPVSDAQTVGSKLISAALTAPLIAIAVGIVCMLGFALIVSMFAMINGMNPLPLFSPIKILTHLSLLVAMLPLYALWALPAIGWLMLCSAWAKRTPFLWAIMIPVFAGIFITWFGFMKVFDLSATWFWQHIVARILLSVFPGSWLGQIDVSMVVQSESLPSYGQLLAMNYGVLASPSAWIGVVVGIAMLAGAVYLRRWRDEG